MNLAVNPACSVSVRLRGIDLVLEGEAHRVTEASTLERVAAVYRTCGCPASVDGDVLTAPVQRAQRGPAAWHLYRLMLHTAVGVATAELYGATRWNFVHYAPPAVRRRLAQSALDDLASKLAAEWPLRETLNPCVPYK